MAADPSTLCFAGFRFPPDVIVVAVRWYLRFGLSDRDVEELLTERGVEVDHVTVYRWVLRFTALVADAAKLATRHSACRAKVGVMNQLKALIVGAPEELRAKLRGLATKRQIGRCASPRGRPARSLEHRMTVRALRSTAPAHPTAGRRGC